MWAWLWPRRALPGGDGPRLVQVQGRLQLRSAAGAMLRQWPLATDVSDQAPHGARQSLLAALHDLPELWEVQLADDAPPVYDGLVHDWRLGEALPSPGHLGVRRVPLARPLDALWVDARVPWVLALARGRPDEVLVIHLDVRRVVARWPWRPGAALTEAVLVDGDEPRLTVPGPSGPLCIDTRRWLRVEGAAVR